MANVLLCDNGGVSGVTGIKLTSDTSGALDIKVGNGSVTGLSISSAGNSGIGVTPSAWSGSKAIDVGTNTAFADISNNSVIYSNAYYNGSNTVYKQSSIPAGYYNQVSGTHIWATAASGTAGNAITFTTAMTLDVSARLAINQSINAGNRLTVNGDTLWGVQSNTSVQTSWPFVALNSATSGDNYLVAFYTDAGLYRGGITYNRGAVQIAYNVSSDYRIKDIYEPFSGSGELIDAITVYRGKMHGATIEKPMFVAHEVSEGGAAWAVTGEKDAVTEDGEIIPQQLSESSLVAVLWAEVKSLRARLAALEAK